ncbi:MAG: NAD(P)/FAD-dependent oxidoreductase [Halanaeroarchaeum sp.]
MRVVVLGGGYAGVVVTDRLERSLPPDVEIVLVDEDGTHLVQHELHRVVREPSYGDTIEVSLKDVFDRATVVEDVVEGVDRSSRTVELAAGGDLSYDVAAVCLGASTAFYDVPGLESNAVPLKRREHADRIHDAVSSLVEEGDGSVVVGGAGLAGVQVAGEIGALIGEHDATVDLTLIEQRDDVAPRFASPFRRAIRDRLLALDVNVLTGEAVAEASPDVVWTDAGREIPTDVLVWTGGIEGSTALDSERPLVRSDLALDDRTFVVGDAGRAIDVDGEEATPSAQTAVGEARVAATNIERIVARSAGDLRPRLDRYDFDPYGWVVSVGDEAVATVGGQVVTGQAARALKSTVGLGYLAASGAIRESVSVLRGEFGFAAPR